MKYFYGDLIYLKTNTSKQHRSVISLSQGLGVVSRHVQQHHRDSISLLHRFLAALKTIETHKPVSPSNCSGLY